MPTLTPRSSCMHMYMQQLSTTTKSNVSFGCCPSLELQHHIVLRWKTNTRPKSVFQHGSLLGQCIHNRGVLRHKGCLCQIGEQDSYWVEAVELLALLLELQTTGISVSMTPEKDQDYSRSPAVRSIIAHNLHHAAILLCNVKLVSWYSHHTGV